MQPETGISVDLTLIWAGIVAFAVFMYVFMDGFDLGVGILFPFAPGGERDRDLMMNTVAPIWDANETWLILGGAGLFAAFPLAYSILLPALYMPILLMLIALIFRGVAFEFRFKAHSSKYLWTSSFFIGSFFASFSQGLILGAFIDGFEVTGRDFSGSIWDWFSPFGILCGFAIVTGYALLGATWLIWRTHGALQDWCRSLAPKLLLGVLVFFALVSLITPAWNEVVRARWFTFPNIIYLAPLPVTTLLVSAWMWTAIRGGRDVVPFVLALVIFVLAFAGLAISLWPYVIPPNITIWDAASPPESQIFLLIGLAFLIPTILAYTAFTYWVFRGKLQEGEGYGH
ncbi:cytochrome d ubiquinol oxidase subunit II [Indioceanicola profundi]|uniref:cytochrome d ubiquinol oxidase subunit II n=1 Tax=Indioceanicola profundi TaxID=2220096 RepID=UPI00298DB7D2|nr:cytochrome d ubiquinol oxidase subunit II [Indioceanicola profundi]